jgi:N-acetylmuramoyl-L-alanine amidase
MFRAVKYFMFLAVWIFGLAWPSSAQAMNRILNIRHWVAPDHTRVVIDMGDEAQYTVEKADRKIIVNIRNTESPSHIPPVVQLNKPGLEGVAIITRAPSGVRVELSVPDQVQTSVFKLNKFQDKPYRIVVDIVLPDVAQKEKEARERVKTARKDRIVVIDPGHGGEAVGAVGKGGTFEKQVALSIARRLRDILNGQPGYNAFLTRDGDYYVSFKKRLVIAKEYGADLFISIHADAAKNREANGISVYCLSTRAASSEAAKILARSENLADVVGGVPNGEGKDSSDPVILDMYQTSAINRSKTFGGSLLKHLKGIGHLKFETVQEAPFRVLKLPDIPSVLVETAYISNLKEEKLLQSEQFQTKIAEGLAQSIAEFLPPPPSADINSSQGKKKDKDKSIRYRVKKGDTLHQIAKMHGTSMRMLLDLNRIKLQDPLHAGRILQIPGKPKEVEKEQTRSDDNTIPKQTAARMRGEASYQVRKGDTLSAIARNHDTTVGVLREINRLKPNDPLYVDRVLVVPVKP